MSDMMKLWREHRIAAVIVMIVRFVVGYAWLTAGWHKITGATPFNAGGFLNNAVNNPIVDKATGEAVYPTYLAFLEHFALPNVKIINVLIPWGEFLVGLGLILGTLTLTAAFFGIVNADRRLLRNPNELHVPVHRNRKHEPLAAAPRNVGRRRRDERRTLRT